MNLNSVIVFDHCIYNENEFWCGDKNVKTLLFHGRVMKSSSIITMQYPSGIPPILYVQFDYLFIFQDTYLPYRCQIWEKYVKRIFPSMEEFCDLMDELVEPYECYVIHISSNFNDLEKIVFYYSGNENNLS